MHKCLVVHHVGTYHEWNYNEKHSVVFSPEPSSDKVSVQPIVTSHLQNDSLRKPEETVLECIRSNKEDEMSMARGMTHGMHSMHSAGWYRMLCLKDAKTEVARRLQAENLQVFREGHLAVKPPKSNFSWC